MNVALCFACGKEIEDEYRLVPIERPYINLFFDLECLAKIPDMKEYLEENISRFQEYDKSLVSANKKWSRGAKE